METRELLAPVSEDLTDYESTDGSSLTERGEEPSMPQHQRLIKTCTMASLYVGLGFNAGVVGPALFDLAEIYTDGNVEVLGGAASMRACGILLGSFLGAFLADRYRKQADLFLFLIMLTNGISSAATPWMPHLYLVGVLFAIQGFNHGAYNVACCSLNIAIWGDQAAGPVHALHMCYSLGLTLSQPITGYFATGVTIEAATITHNNGTKLLYNTLSNNKSHVIELEGAVGENSTASGTRIYVPYGIFGTYQIALSFAFLAFFFAGAPYTSTTIAARQTYREMLDPSSCTGGRGCYGVYMLSSLFSMYVLIAAREATMTTYICATGMYLFGMSAFKASLLGMTYHSLILLSRILATIVALFVRIQIMVCVEQVIGFVLFLLTSVFGLKDLLSFWLLASGLALSIGPLYPSLMAWADRYIESTGFVVAIIDAGIGAGIFLANYLGGVVIHRLDARWLYYLCAVGSGFLLIFLLLQGVASRYGDRHSQVDSQYKALESTELTDR